MQNLHARYRDSLPCIGMHDMLFYVFKTYKVVPSLSTVVDCNSYFQRTKHNDKYKNLNIVALFLKNLFQLTSIVLL